MKRKKKTGEGNCKRIAIVERGDLRRRAVLQRFLAGVFFAKRTVGLAWGEDRRAGSELSWPANHDFSAIFAVVPNLHRALNNQDPDINNPEITPGFSLCASAWCLKLSLELRGGVRLLILISISFIYHCYRGAEAAESDVAENLGDLVGLTLPIDSEALIEGCPFR